ncbi:hypothetical protein SynBOUM118_00400 [Synechococcus sp. BOUM118]|nr:hypothetical protein SynBOUM118_00400 [Synechococcus sp. BOUM118]
MADITRDQAIAQFTDGKTPSEARRLIESFDRTVLIQELLSGNWARLKAGENWYVTWANFLELLSDCLCDLRHKGFLQGDSDVSAVGIYLVHKAQALRESQADVC